MQATINIQVFAPNEDRDGWSYAGSTHIVKTGSARRGIGHSDLQAAGSDAIGMFGGDHDWCAVVNCEGFYPEFVRGR